MRLFIDFGGTKFRYQLDHGEVSTLASESVDLVEFIDSMIASHPIESVAISFAGQVQDGVILSSPNTHTKPIDLKARFSIPIFIDNDLNCAALAEYHEHPASMLAVLYIGTGFGSAFVSEGKIIAGASNQAGEIGHIPFRPTNFTCACGRDDCVELSTSGQALIRRLGSAEVLDEPFLSGLAHALLTMSALFDPDVVVLGGGVVTHHPELVEFARVTLKTAPFNRNKKEISVQQSYLNEGSLEGTKYLQKGG